MEGLTMRNEMIPAVAKEVIGSGHFLAKNVINACNSGAERALGACDDAWKAGATAMANGAELISPKLKSDLIIAQREITGAAEVVTTGVARGAVKFADFAAGTATLAVDQFDDMFDNRVMQSLNRLGMPAVQVIRELTDQVEFLSQELAKVAAEGEVKVPLVRKPVARKARAKAA
jgi:hypothetical protein